MIFLRSVVLLALLLSSTTLVGAADRPNVVFIMADDLNAWVGHLGRNSQARTPNIDRLAKMGMAFTRAYAAVPACEPSRAALMSGKRPWTTGCYLNGDAWEEHLTAGEQLTAPFLAAGYHVAGAGKIFHHGEYFPSEWTEYMDESRFSRHGEGVRRNEGFRLPVQHDLQDEDLMDWHTVTWCIEQLEQPRDQPFFIACGLLKPHLPFVVPRKYYDQFPLDEIELPPFLENDLDDLPPEGRKMALQFGDQKHMLESGRWKDAIRSYLAAGAYADMNVGRLLDAIERSPKRDNTIIVFLGDHGWSFGEKHHWRKFALWEEPTRAPLVWVAPGVTPAGAACDRPVDFMSIYPTLCELAGLPVPQDLDGHSLVPLLENPEAPWDIPAISTQGRGNHAVRLGSWRYIRYAEGGEELYDHDADPYEWENLAADPARAEIKERLAGLLIGVEP